MKGFIFFCMGTLVLYKCKRRPVSQKIDGIIFWETGVNFAYQLGIVKYMQQTFYLNLQHV